MKYLMNFLFCFCHVYLFAQKYDNVWTMGLYTPTPTPLGYGTFQINFSNNTPDFIPQNQAINRLRGNSSISDSAGNLLFYTNGFTIGNVQHDTMMNGTHLHGGGYFDEWGSAGSPCIHEIITIPKPASETEYYIFEPYHLWASNVPITKLLYSKIDMSLDNGLGAVVEKNIPIIDSTMLDTLANFSVTAVKHGNGRDWWVVISEVYAQYVYLVLVTPNGVQLPIRQKVSNVKHNANAFNIFSPNGEKFVQYVTTNNIAKLRIMDFDRCGAVFSNERWVQLPCQPCAGWGLSISPNSRWLYQNYYDKIYQYDLEATNIQNSKILVATNDGFLDTTQQQPVMLSFNEPQLAPNGKIYISSANNGTPYMHVIHSPDNQGIACSVEQHIQLPHKIMNSVPHFPNYRLGAKVGSACDTLSVSNQLAVNSKQIKVYPNPAQNYIQVELPQGLREATFVLYNALGQVVQQTDLQASTLVRLGNVAKGLYFYEVIFKEGEIYGKLQVE
ncbi:MAG: T9SS type A sorting domain-containing protein [Bacteroidia bacterium]